MTWSKSRLARWLTEHTNRLQPSEDVTLIATAIIVGVSTGLGSVILPYLIDAVAYIGFEIIPQLTSGLGNLYIILVPMLGGLLAGPLIYRFAREAKGHGVPEVMLAIALRGGRLRPAVAAIKAIASSLTIGSGGSAGREGPIVQIGAALGSVVGQVFNLSEDRIRNLVACGAAGGIAATFNAPIAGVIFALEVILGEFSVRYFSTVVISSVIASVIARIAFGNHPAFPLPQEYGVISLWEYAFYPVLGLLAAVVGVYYVRMIYAAEDLFDRWRGVPEWLKPAVGGALLGILALVYPALTGVTYDGIPQIFGVGYDVIEAALFNRLMLHTVLVLMVLKLIATALTLGSGASGGVFAPSLFIGAMLGTAFELVIKAIFPTIPAPPGAYALVGMAAVFTASAHAPMTAIVMLFELTDDYRIILPLMLTVTIATLFSRYMLDKESIYTLKLTRRGIRLERGRDIDVMQGVTVQETMQQPAPTITRSASLSQLRDSFHEHRTRSLCVVDSEGELCGIVTLGDLQNAYSLAIADENMNAETLTVGDICIDNVVTIRPDEAIWKAIRIMDARDIGRLPVVAASSNKPIGLLRRHDIMHAYNIAITRKLQDQHRAEQMRLNVLTGAHVFEVHIAKSSPTVGKRIQDINLPTECVVAAIRRKDKLIVPHGYTPLEAGDRLTIVSEPEVEAPIHALFENVNT